MHHYIYRVKSSSGKYYIGRHSTKNLDDGYLGSGKWVRSIKDKSVLEKEILEFCESFDELLALERKYINEHIGNEDCMNFNNSPIGFSTGDMNIAKTETERLKRSKRATDNNPSRLPGVGEKISRKLKGRTSARKGIPLSDKAKANISAARKGIKFSEEGKQKLSESRKRQYENGEREVPSFKGKKHDKETIERMKDAANNRPLLKCAHCGKDCTKQNLKRWHGDKCKNLEQNGY